MWFRSAESRKLRGALPFDQHDEASPYHSVGFGQPRDFASPLQQHAGERDRYPHALSLTGRY